MPRDRVGAGLPGPPSHNTLRAVPHTAFPVCDPDHAVCVTLRLFRSPCRLLSHRHLDHLPGFRSFQRRRTPSVYAEAYARDTQRARVTCRSRQVRPFIAPVSAATTPFSRTAPTMVSADFSLRLAGSPFTAGVLPATLRAAYGVRPRSMRGSSGMRRDLPGYDAPAFTLMPVGSKSRRPCKYRTLAFLAASPQRGALYPLLVREASALPPASSRRPVTRNAVTSS